MPAAGGYATSSAPRPPQHFADRFGWQEMTEAVARVHGALPPTERREAAIVTSNYGEAGAINYFGPRLGLKRP